jgi:hypothetical protein
LRHLSGIFVPEGGTLYQTQGLPWPVAGKTVSSEKTGGHTATVKG